MKAEQAARRRGVYRRYSAQDRERLIREQTQSGLTKRAFCERQGIKPWTFYGWTKRRRKRERVRTFAEVEVASYAPAAVEVLLPNGARIGIRHHGKRDDLVALIRGVAGC